MSDHHKFHMRLPRNGREFPLFLLIVSLISVNIIAPLAVMLEVGFSLAAWQDILKVLPYIWVVVVALVILTHTPAKWLAGKTTKPTDSFKAHIVIELLFNVLLMSLLMTVLGNWIGTGSINTYPLEQFIYLWPRNFIIAFAVEVLVAHPVAHLAMYHYHLRRDGAVSSRFIKPSPSNS